MNILITRCTLWDLAGRMMIEGFSTGIGEDHHIGALVFEQNSMDSPPGLAFVRQFIDPKDIDEAFKWADACIDLGGLCRGYDPYRHNYIIRCRKKDIPYVYGAQSFDRPDPRIIKDIPLVARGENAKSHATKVLGLYSKDICVAPDVSFLCDIPPMFESVDYAIGYCTHINKPFLEMDSEIERYRADATVKITLKPNRDGKEFEPFLRHSDVLEPKTAEDLFSIVGRCNKILTARYHVAVAAIAYKIPVYLYVDQMEKYDDLLDWEKVPLARIKEEAYETIRLFKEVCGVG